MMSLLSSVGCAAGLPPEPRTKENRFGDHNKKRPLLQPVFFIHFSWRQVRLRPDADIENGGPHTFRKQGRATFESLASQRENLTNWLKNS